jgi:translocation and assembly module TamB
VTLSREQPYEPQLAVVATTRRFNYDLRMDVTGPANAPVVAFSSSPPLEHGQILLMVTAGEAPQSEVTFSDRQRAQRLGMFIGQSLFASLGDADSAERLTLTSGERISREGKETLEAEFKLSKRWSVTAEVPDEFDQWGAGVKVRVYTKGGRDDAVAGKSHESDQK